MKYQSKEHEVFRQESGGKLVLIAEAGGPATAELIVKALNLLERSYGYATPEQGQSNPNQKDCEAPKD